MLILIDLIQKCCDLKIGLDEVAVFIPDGETLAGSIQVRVLSHMCSLRTPFIPPHFVRLLKWKAALELKLVPSNLEICLEHTIGVFQDMNN